MRTHATAAATALALSLANCGSSSHGSAPPLRVVSSISDRATLAGALQWTAVPAGVRSADPVARVDFLVDGRQRWTDRRAPFVFNDDHNVLHPWILARGSHRLAVRLVTTLGKTVGTASQVTVAPTPAVPSALAGRWTRRLTAADTRRAAGRTVPTGVWHARFAHDGVVFFAGPRGAGGTEAFTAIRTGLIALAGPVLWLAPEQRRGGLCDTERLAPYEWRVEGSTLTLTSRHDSGCSNRAALFSGTWTHQRHGGFPL
ncbi:MAG: hypothetical protein QOD24_4232 [Solirubrobacteraceae bacterium]|nr:hypothetical protein [Solirubrobacteraceae bacterium]